MSTLGKMAVDMRVNTEMTRSMAMVSILGLICVSTKECGSEANSTVSAFTWFPTKTQNAVSGRKENALNGSIRAQPKRS